MHGRTIDDARGSSSSLRDELFERLRTASGGLAGNWAIAHSTTGVDGEDVDLSGRRVAVLAADGVEKVEVTVPVAALRAAGADVDIISLRHGRIRSVNLHEPAARITVDRTLDEADPEDYDALLIPGGFIGPDLLRQSADAREFVQAFDGVGKPIATLCHGPWLLASAGLTAGRLMTSWPGVRDDMVNGGATWVDEPVVHDGNWVTSRSPQDFHAFVPAMLSLFAERMDLARVRDRESGALARHSSPQPTQPPGLMLRVMQALPRPSLRTAAVIGVVGAAMLASRAMRR